MAVGLAFVLEGTPYFLFPGKMPKIMLTMATQPRRHLRILGLTSIIFGILLVAFGRSLNP